MSPGGACVRLAPTRGLCIKWPPSPGVWVAEPVFPPASVGRRQGATSRTPLGASEGQTRGPRAPTQLPKAQAARSPQTLTPALAAPAPRQPRGTPRPAHFAATRRTSGRSGMASPGAMRKERGSGTLRAGRRVGAARVRLQLLSPS